jgi:hypothetical protein
MDELVMAAAAEDGDDAAGRAWCNVEDQAVAVEEGPYS